MGKPSQFGQPRVKNLSRSVNKPEWSIFVLILSYLKQMIPPVFTWAPKYQLGWFWKDFVAGLSTGVYGIPQTMALGVLAGLTAVDGLYTSLAPAIVYVLLGPSRSMSVGPVSVISLLVGNAIASSASPALVATSINFFMGVIFLGLGFLRVGFLSTLISRPVVVGFTSAAAVLVDTTQVKHVLGLKAATNANLIDFFQIIVPAIKKGPINGWATLIALSCLFFLISLRFHPRLKPVPGPVVVTVLWILLTWGFQLNKTAGLTVVGNIPSGLPVPQLPFAPAKELRTIVGSLIVISAISLVEIVSISKTFAVKAGTIINTNTELIAIGSAALIGSFFRAFPISASFSRTALNDSAGARSQFSSVVRR
jgi:SulP family sulfate permease